MTQYTVLYDYTIPQFTDIEVDAENEEQARVLADEAFGLTYPEAIDPEIVEVKVG